MIKGIQIILPVLTLLLTSSFLVASVNAETTNFGFGNGNIIQNNDLNITNNVDSGCQTGNASTQTGVGANNTATSGDCSNSASVGTFGNNNQSNNCNCSPTPTPVVPTPTPTPSTGGGDGGSNGGGGNGGGGSSSSSSSSAPAKELAKSGFASTTLLYMVGLALISAGLIYSQKGFKTFNQ